ncbi:hypothetical protein SCALM49S_08275 [Streptomyces californicus]
MEARKGDRLRHTAGPWDSTTGSRRSSKCSVTGALPRTGSVSTTAMNP